ncbi:hypothetical protein CAL7716_053370 [Calothrix sp. PCC 7716]|nr:hypothetical protein CAL7716_053370 [Calothrix sp. PCC 7716]
MALERATNRQQMDEAISEAALPAKDLETISKGLHSLIRLTDMSFYDFFIAISEVLERNGASNQSVWSAERLADFFLKQ